MGTVSSAALQAPGPAIRPPGSRNYTCVDSRSGDALYAEGARGDQAGGGVRPDGSEVLWAGLVVCALTQSICSDLQEQHGIRLDPSLMRQVLKFYGELVVPRDQCQRARNHIHALDSSLTVLRLLPQTRAVEDVLSLPDMAQVRLSELYFTGDEVNHASHSMSSVVGVVACVL
eukprot:Tamp_16873.p1 GENE.Tamp_16873~~Tamp_16873.p1  ORF type:complete len:183 (-),score=13.96 Tamp_16873:882-1400(-)